jgi:hypothetical protein
MALVGKRTETSTRCQAVIEEAGSAVVAAAAAADER